MKTSTKNLLLAFTIFIFNFSFGQSMHHSSVMALAGAYTLQKQTINFGHGDSVTGRDQLKIYTGNYMMYVRHRDADTLAEYGIGTYEVKGNTVKENIFFNSDGPTSAQFKLAVSKTKNGYSQTIEPDYDAQGHAGLTKEEYVQTNHEGSTILDGAWKQSKVVFLPANGTVQVNNNPVQFKVYQSGSYMWASTSVDAAVNQTISYYGYGTYKMKGEETVFETIASSSFVSQHMPKPVVVHLKFSGKNSYAQTINFANGDVLVEYYDRMK